MQLLCLGDVGIVHETDCKARWQPPLPGFPDDGKRILFNWEFPVGTELNPGRRSSGVRYLADLQAPDALRDWRPGFATMATNHMLDAGPAGVAATKQLLLDAGFETVGAGGSREEIASPLVWETEQGRLTILNWVFPETHPDWQTVPGVNCWPGLKEAERIIRDIRKTTDWLLVIPHWSDELFAYPRPEDRLIAERLAKAGVDGIVAHHPHVVRGMETFDSIPVFYSIGNYFFSDLYDWRTGKIEKSSPRSLESLGVLMTFKAGCKPVYEPVSFLQKDGQVSRDKSNRAVRRMRSLSKPFPVFQGDAYQKWHETKKRHFSLWGERWHFVARRLGFKGTISYGFKKLQHSR